MDLGILGEISLTSKFNLFLLSFFNGLEERKLKYELKKKMPFLYLCKCSLDECLNVHRKREKYD